MSKGLLFVGLVCLCLSAVSATQLEDFMLSVQDTPFGKTMWGTIELEVQNGAPGDYLIELLKKMQKTVEDDAKQSNATHEKFQANCKTELGALKGEIRKHARDVLESKKLISKAQQELSWNQAQVDSQERQKKEAKAGLEKVTGIREKEAAEYTEKITELNKALVVLHQGKSMVEKNLKTPSGSSFVEVSNQMNQYVDSMVSILDKPQYHGRGYVSVIKYVAEMLQAPVANQQGVDRILNIIQKIIDELEQAKNVEYKAEQERIKNFEELKKMYESTIVELGDSIQRLKNQINSLQQTITYNTNRISEATRSIQVKSRQKLKLKKECRSEESTFAKENKKRMADLDLVSQALSIIEEHVDEFRKIVLETAKSRIGGHYEAKAQAEKEKKGKN